MTYMNMADVLKPHFDTLSRLEKEKCEADARFLESEKAVHAAVEECQKLLMLAKARIQSLNEARSELVDAMKSLSSDDDDEMLEISKKVQDIGSKKKQLNEHIQTLEQRLQEMQDMGLALTTTSGPQVSPIIDYD